jgi:tetratricopeptide (TPR) repeat protein
MRRRREILDDKKVFGPAEDDEIPDKETILTLDKSLEKKLEDMKVSDPYIGTTIDGRYLLHEKLGAGGMGAVYRATHVLMDKPVAIKLISRELTHLPQVVGRFEREARSASRLSHPHCITVTDFGRTEDGTLYLVMELLDGEPLEDMLNRLNTLPPPLAIHFTRQILEGLSHAHEAGIVHRDLKPANVMIVNQGEKRDFAIVFDFGIAKIATDTGTDNKLTQQGMIVGTPAYISPEQALGDDADHRADLYAVGVMLYEMLTGDVPYRGAQAVDVVTMHISADIPSLPPGRRSPVGLRQVIEQAMSKKPVDRFQTADQFLAAVNAIDIGRTEFIRKGGQRTGWVVLLFVLLGVLAFAAAFGVWYLKERRLSKAVKKTPLPEVEKATIVEDPVSLEVDQKQVADLLKKAEEQIRLGIPTEAVTTAKLALRQSPDEPVGRLLLGHALFLSGKRTEAMDAYETALEGNPNLIEDERLMTHLEEALKWDGANEKAAAILAERGGAKGIELLKNRANSPLSDRDERSVSRKALISIDKEVEIDWLATLTADFNDFKACAKRRQIIEQMDKTQDPRFLPLLEAQRPAKGRWMGAYKCIAVELERAISSLKRVAESMGTDVDKLGSPEIMDNAISGGNR